MPLDRRKEIKKGKIQASPNAHDDSVMSWLIGLYVYYYGKNLNRYGLIKGYKPPTEADRMRQLKASYNVSLQYMSESDREYFKGTQSFDYEDYYDKLIKEKEKAMRQISRYDEDMGENTFIEDYNTYFDSIDSDINSDLDNGWLNNFDDLNEFDDD